MQTKLVRMYAWIDYNYFRILRQSQKMLAINLTVELVKVQMFYFEEVKTQNSYTPQALNYSFK